MGFLLRRRILLKQNEVTNSFIRLQIRVLIKDLSLNNPLSIKAYKNLGLIKYIVQWVYEKEERYIWIVSSYFNKRYPLENYYEVLNNCISCDKGFSILYKNRIKEIVSYEIEDIVDEVLKEIFFNSY